MIGLCIDWAIALVIANGLLRSSGLGVFAPLVVLFVEHTLMVGTAGYTIGHRLAGIGVARLDGRPAGIPKAALRSLLLVLAIPPLISGADQRGLHDRAAGTAIVRL